MELAGVISADIVGSTSIVANEKLQMLHNMSIWLEEIDSRFGSYSRISHGDLIELVSFDVSLTMRLALLIKTKVKSLLALESQKRFERNSLTNHVENKRFSYFKFYGVRMAIHIGEMLVVDAKKGIIEGPAIHTTGRVLSKHNTYEKNRIVIKNTIHFTADNLNWESEFQSVFSLLDYVISHATARQCEILVFRLLGETESSIAEKLEINQVSVNQASIAAGWREIEKSLHRFESIIWK
jgi:hypothetical protein